MTYRKTKGTDTWHFCKNCSNWPTHNYEEVNSATRPSTGELCNQCKAKEANKTCQK